MKLYNTLSRKVEDFKPLENKKVRIYSCGPTIYDHVHIGNLSSFVYVDTLRRALVAEGYEVEHVMNFTDVSDKIILRAGEKYPELAPEEALKKLTDEYKQLFLDDMKAIGNDVSAIKFVSAVESIPRMQTLIAELYKNGFAYIAEDGVYFSIEKYKASGKKYGQLLELTSDNTSVERIQNDEYDKESVHDFALWKAKKDNEPAWDFELDGHNLLGRPGWHIECSAMSVEALGQPFDIHTGGVDLIFPHHENEIAQSTAGKDEDYAKFFVHNEHLLVDGKKMSKSLNNFYTLTDIKEKGFDPLAFRLLVLQSHYRKQSNFSWENLETAQNLLRDYKGLAERKWQSIQDSQAITTDYVDYVENELPQQLIKALGNDLNSPMLMFLLNEAKEELNESVSEYIIPALKLLDSATGLNLSASEDINDHQKQLLEERKTARKNSNFTKSDDLRNELEEQGIGVRDTDQGQIWYRL